VSALHTLVREPVPQEAMARLPLQDLDENDSVIVAALPTEMPRDKCNRESTRGAAPLPRCLRQIKLSPFDSSLA
jgi:hypothetical protein